jgi:hypothetical protein
MELRKKYVTHIPFLRKVSERVVMEILFLMRETTFDADTIVIK